MSHPLSDALVQSIASRYDPESQTNSRLIDQHLQEAHDSLVNRRMDTMSRIAKAIEVEKSKDAPDTLVVDAYQRMLDSYAKLPVAI